MRQQRFGGGPSAALAGLQMAPQGTALGPTGPAYEAYPAPAPEDTGIQFGGGGGGGGRGGRHGKGGGGGHGGGGGAMAGLQDFGANLEDAQTKSVTKNRLRGVGVIPDPQAIG